MYVVEMSEENFVDKIMSSIEYRESAIFCFARCFLQRTEVGAACII